MKQGAFHDLAKPFDFDGPTVLVEKGLETTRLRREVKALRASRSEPYFVDRIIGESPAMIQLKALLEKIAGSPGSTVLLTGERGTGKNLAAKVIHFNSPRAAGPFMNVTCSALAETALERLPLARPLLVSYSAQVVSLRNRGLARVQGEQSASPNWRGL